MKIEHLAIWVDDLEGMKDFYVKYFELDCNNKYSNIQKQFTSYFLSFKSGGARIELMRLPDIENVNGERSSFKGFTHFAISVGNKEKVDALTELLRNDGFIIKAEPRTTGDGYYESVVLDPEGNAVEITI